MFRFSFLATKIRVRQGMSVDKLTLQIPDITHLALGQAFMKCERNIFPGNQTKYLTFDLEMQ